MNTIAAYTPGHVTGIFHIADLAEDPLHRGSLGAGFSIDTGVTTRITVLDETPGEPVFSIGGIPSADLKVSAALYRHFTESLPDIPAKHLQIDHIIKPPQGSGFGTSGAGALSLALALNQCFGKPFSSEAVAGLAHITEIECRTGLGTVIGEFYGGVEIRTAPGAPGFGKIVTIPHSRDTRAVFAVRGPYSTSVALSDPEIRDSVNRAGSAALKQLQKEPCLKKFQELSRQFALDTGLCTPWVQSVLHLLEKKDIVGSMLMFGEAVFALVDTDRVREVESLLRKHGNGGFEEKLLRIFSSALNTTGGRYL